MSNILIATIQNYVKEKQEIQNLLLESMNEGVHYFIEQDFFEARVLKKDGAKHIIEAHGYTYEFTDASISERTLPSGIVAANISCQCIVKDSDGAVISRGFGARRLDMDYHIENNALKSARRNAIVDAALHIKSMGGLFSAEKSSEYDYQNTNQSYAPVATQTQTPKQPHQEMSVEDEEEFLNRVSEQLQEPVSNEAPVQAQTTGTEALIKELKDISPENWLEDLPAMYERDSLEAMTVKELTEALGMMKTNIEQQSQENSTEEDIFV